MPGSAIDAIKAKQELTISKSTVQASGAGKAY